MAESTWSDIAKTSTTWSVPSVTNQTTYLGVTVSFDLLDESSNNLTDESSSNLLGERLP